MSTAEGTGPRSPLAVAELTEEELLASLVPLLPRGRHELVGTGDDCAVLAAPDARYCVSTDLLVEGRHFSTGWSSPQEIGARAAAQNLADVAAMGARPVALVVGLVLPPATPPAWVQDLACGMARACGRAGAGIVGGDLSAGESLVIAVTAHGDLEERARAAARQALSVFRVPAPPLAAGPALAGAGATAMMDVSDGLLRDAGRMAAASRVRIDITDIGVGEPAGVRDGAGGDMAALEPVARLLEGSPAAAHALARRWVLTG